MMLWKNRKKRVGLCVMVVTASLVLAVVWAVLATPETALAHKDPDDPDHSHGGGGSDPGGNVVQQDIPAILTLGGGGLTGDGEPYSDLENGISCAVGRRRSIWVRLSKTSDRKMNLTLTGLNENPFTIEQGDDTIQIDQGDDPWGDPVMAPDDVQSLALPTGPISQVELQIAPYLNVSGLEAEDVLPVSTWLLFLDGDKQWGLYFGPGRTTEDGWGGARFFTELDAGPVIVSCLTENKSWTVTSTTPGYLWYKGSKKNAPWVYVGKCNVPWSCDAEDLL